MLEIVRYISRDIGNPYAAERLAVAKIEKGRDRDKGAVRERIDDGDLRDPVDNEQHERCRKPEDKTPRSGAPGCGSIDLGHGVKG